MTDVLVIGKGPAGWSCAMTARMRNLSVQVIAPAHGESMLALTDQIANYPGMPMCSGKEILEKFRAQALALGAEERTGLVRLIQPARKSFMALVDNDVVQARSVVIAVGAPRPLLLPGEEALIGKGISYCATCDGMFYRGKRVAVLADNEQGIEEAAFLRRLNCEVDYYPLKQHSLAGLAQAEGIRLAEEKPAAFEAEDGQIAVCFPEGKASYQGVFIFRKALPVGMLLPNLELREQMICVDRSMSTNIPGVFAAGDCTGKPLQIAKAVGEGNVAALSAAEYLRALG